MVSQSRSRLAIIPLEKEHLIGYYSESFASLGAKLRDSYNLSIHKPIIKIITQYCKSLELFLASHNKLDSLHFITIRPSPEFVYMEKGRIPSYDEQLSEWLNRILDSPVDILAVSIEKGTKNTQLLHYHVIVHSKNKKQYNQWFKTLVNTSTCLHKIYGYQKSVYESETSAVNLYDGITYFNGISKNTNGQSLKPDVYKHIINHTILEKIKKRFKNKLS